MKDKLINLTYVAGVAFLLTMLCMSLAALASSGLAVPVGELIAIQASQLAQTVREAL